MGELENKVALVTGATGGIGRAVCIALARDGADIGICYGSKTEAAENLAREISKMGRRSCLVKADVSKREEAFSAVSKIRAALGPVDILVNNAGITMTGKIEEITEEDWHRCLAVNLDSVLFFTQAVLPDMKRRNSGTIVNISSLGAKIGGINAAASYSVSKAGISCLTIQTAKELLETRINVNAVAPGVIDTELWKVYGREKRDASFRNVARGPGRPEDVAEAVVFLASPKASYITGEILDVNGGVFMD